MFVSYTCFALFLRTYTHLRESNPFTFSDCHKFVVGNREERTHFFCRSVSHSLVLHTKIFLSKNMARLMLVEE
jgi:hypothetical protein